jgi:hypothetical protein
MARRRLARLLAVLVVAAGAAALVWAFVLRDTTEPISVDEALAEFARGGGVGEGVYVYATTGFEETDALTGQRHDYPAESAVTVAVGGCGAVAAWQPLRGRTLAWELCIAGDGQVRRRLLEVHTFFGNRDRQDYVCEPPTRWWSSSLAPGTSWESRCASADRTETGTVTVTGLDTVDVGDEQVGAIVVREAFRLEGVTEGTGSREWWLDRTTGLVLRLRVENSSVTQTAIGGVGYQERFELVLTSLDSRS